MLPLIRVTVGPERVLPMAAYGFTWRSRSYSGSVRPMGQEVKDRLYLWSDEHTLQYADDVL